MMDWADAGWSWWWMLPMMVFLAVVIVGVVWALVGIARDARGPSAYGTAEDILDERFARGEIDAAEYGERLHALRGRSPAKR